MKRILLGSAALVGAFAFLPAAANAGPGGPVIGAAGIGGGLGSGGIGRGGGLGGGGFGGGAVRAGG
ncbi:hypothetical protein ACFQ4I_26235, partial [Methylorubrum suomiense]